MILNMPESLIIMALSLFNSQFFFILNQIFFIWNQTYQESITLNPFSQIIQIDLFPHSLEQLIYLFGQWLC